MPTWGRNSAALPAGGLALVAWISLVATLSPHGAGPGLTCDEYYYAAHGKRMLRSLFEQGPRFFQRANIENNFGLMHEHPPLAAFCLGIAQAPFDRFPERPDLVWIPSARLASATGMALLIAAVVWITARTVGNLAGLAAGVSLLCMPRAFAHAHLASLDLLTAVFSFAAILTLYWATNDRTVPTRRVELAGLMWGLSLLCKVNGLLLAPPLTIWLIANGRRRALKPLLIWYTTGLLTFLLGWPWLWAEPWSRLSSYLSSTTQRVTIHNYYLGQSWADFETPWHYPWVMTAVTIPVGLMALAAIGALCARQIGEPGRLARMMLLNLVCLLGAFSLPGVPVYDGARLFLLIYPLCAVLVGLGTWRVLAWPWMQRLGPRLSTGVLAALLLVQAHSVVRYHPFQLSYYNALVGGLPGAERLGFEVTYWGDAVTGELMRATAETAMGPRVWFVPTLAPWQVTAQRAVFPQLEAQGILLEPFSPETVPASDARWAVVYHRRADEASWAPLVADAEIVAENAIGGVWLARLVRLSQENSMSGEFTHFDEQGASRMVDVGDKQITRREARASAVVRMQATTLEQVRTHPLRKGDVLAVARLAGIMAAKRTPELIPLCHVLPLDSVTIDYAFPDDQSIAIEATVRVTAKTGVEMEALTAASVAALTIYDMCKSLDRGMRIEQVRLEEKSGGKSGHFRRET